MTSTTVRTRIKICGLTRKADVQAAVQTGADALGFVFYPNSKRALSVQQAKTLRHAVPAFVSVVALFVNASSAHVTDVIQQVQPDLLQFHGDETPQECRQYGVRYLRAFRVGSTAMATSGQVLDVACAYHDAAAWLFDTHSDGYGGSGQAFDRTLLSDILVFPAARPVVLAGGLDARSVGAAINDIHPYGVDVSSGVERSPGIKSEAHMRDFVEAVSRADSTADYNQKTGF